MSLILVVLFTWQLVCFSSKINLVVHCSTIQTIEVGLVTAWVPDMSHWWDQYIYLCVMLLIKQKSQKNAALDFLLTFSFSVQISISQVNNGLSSVINWVLVEGLEPGSAAERLRCHYLQIRNRLKWLPVHQRVFREVLIWCLCFCLIYSR